MLESYKSWVKLCYINSLMADKDEGLDYATRIVKNMFIYGNDYKHLLHAHCYPDIAK
jgi:hypothetical protein